MTTQRSSRRRIAASAVAVAALLVTAGCGGGGSDGEGDGKAPGFNAANGKTANASDKKGGTLKFIGTQDADSWDTTRGYYGFAWDFMRYYSRTLITSKPVAGKESSELVPDLAKAKAKISDDGKTYSYELRDGITWEDGKPVTSKDIKYGIERQWAQDVLSGGPIYLKDTLDPDGKYKGPYKDKSKDKLGLEAIETPSDTEIVFKLPKRNGDFEQMLAMPSASPVRQDKDTKSKYGLKPFSNGPYKFESYTPNKKLSLVRNPEWKKSSDNIRKALPDKITLTLITNSDEMDKRLINGDYDLDINATGMEAAGRQTALKEHKGNIDNPSTGYIRYAVFPQTVKPFDNIHCRKAMIYGSDHKSIQNARGGPLAGGDIGTNMLPKLVPGSDLSFDPYGIAKNDGKADVAKAKAELKKCGKPNGFKTTIAVRNNKQVEIASAEAMQASLKKIGIEAEVDEYDGAQTTGIIGNPEYVKKKNYGIIIMGWGPDFPSGQGYGMPLWHSKYILDNGNNNYAMIDDKKIDGMFADAIAELDKKKAAEKYAAINAEVMKGAYYLPFTFEKNIIWRSSRLTNVGTTDAFSGRYDYAVLGVK
ncbi:peptide ABC transporter substrate-binding protein [Streptomyces abyssalis]|uniref:Peptide ABC transporter substrate-binding protein n=1 Tax=Streptomyces abyssalis TaxID=933944 RepID=A0A1E7JIT9_9ACTN|nr:ABC transporter substrate-binding protein [Streptomyces abyssalis]OEU86367.1 peptide ABC transporter substrate-binding protein [Streptomyces abyssalis]OEU93280.1 peptide ABC transporter substrate-binding protein [Streptomyces abyssalis]OEV27864.1 peptide ABC transporter substrate-binding protein [Streptomyces nanshensis]